MSARRKLFSNGYEVRRKLFSDDSVERGEVDLKTVICNDCGYRLETSASTSHLLCPKCGGTRFNIDYEFDHEPYEINEIKEVDPLEKSRMSLFKDKDGEEMEFQSNFSNPGNKFEERLKEFSGKAVDSDDCERLFGVPAEEMVEKGFADVEGDRVNISDTAFLESRLFSKLIVSITKIFDLEPKITCPTECGLLDNPLDRKAEIIDNLEHGNHLCPKGIIMIRRAHGIIPVSHEPECIEEHSDNDSWTRDSGILNDLKLEFGGSSHDLPEFKRTLTDRYPDAPMDLMDLLKNRGVIKVISGRVNVL